MMSTYSTDVQEDIATMSKRIQSNPMLIRQLNKFHQLTQPNQNNLKMIEQANSNNRQGGFKNHISLKNYPKEMTIVQVQKEKKVYELEKKIPFKEDFPFCGLIIKVFIICFVIFFVLDFYSQLETQRQRKTKEIAKCYQEYIENNCASPLEALIQQCSRLQFCASRDPIKMTKTSDVFVNSLVTLFSKLAGQLTYIGIFAIALLAIIYLYRPSMYNEERISKFL